MTKPKPSAVSIRDFIWFALLILMGGTLYGTMTARQTALETSLLEFRAKYDREVVPRSEHIQMNSVTEERWRAVDSRLTAVQQDMKDIAREVSDLKERKR